MQKTKNNMAQTKKAVEVINQAMKEQPEQAENIRKKMKAVYVIEVREKKNSDPVHVTFNGKEGK